MSQFYDGQQYLEQDCTDHGLGKPPNLHLHGRIMMVNLCTVGGTLVNNDYSLK
jgi:hypothetical protein